MYVQSKRSRTHSYTMECIPVRPLDRETVQAVHSVLLCGSVLPFELRRFILISMGILRPTNEDELDFVTEMDLSIIYQFDLSSSLDDMNIDPELCVEYGSIKCFQRYIDNGGRCTSELYTIAAHHGHLEIMKLLRDNNVNISAMVYPNLFMYGHIHCLQWMLTCNIQPEERHLFYASKSSMFVCLRWWIDNDLPRSYQLCSRLVRHYPMECLLLAHESGFELCSQFFIAAAERGEIDYLEFGYKHGGNRVSLAYDAAIRKGHMEVLDWLWEHQFPTSRSAYIEAIKYDRPDGLNWLFQHKFHVGSDGYNQAASTGNLTILQLLLDHNVPKPKNVFESAAYSGHLHVLEWLLINDFNKGKSVTLAAVENNQVDCLKWSIVHDFPKCEDAYRTAARGGCLDCLQILSDNDFPRGGRRSITSRT